jgi:lipoate synthase
VFDDLRRVGVSILTIGQYLRPSAEHAPMTRYYHPDEFATQAGSRSHAASCTSSPGRWCVRRITRTSRADSLRPLPCRGRFS